MIGVGQQSHAYEARQGRSDFGGSKIADEQFPTIRAETVLNGFGGRLSDQRRQEDAGIQIVTQPLSTRTSDRESRSSLTRCSAERAFGRETTREFRWAGAGWREAGRSRLGSRFLASATL
jgi:hypothetical protein